MLLEVADVHAGYGNVPVLRGVSLSVRPAEVVALLGHNGAGKTTLLRAVYGLITVWKGRIAFDGQDVHTPAGALAARRGMALVPQGKGVFGGLTVGENLRLGLWASGLRDKDPEARRRLERVFGYLPVLRNRWNERCRALSGGQQQLVSIGRALLVQPRLLLLDEPSVGLAPIMVEQTMELVGRLRDEERLGVVLVEQNVRQALTIADRVAVLKNGRIIRTGEPAELGVAEQLWALF